MNRLESLKALKAIYENLKFSKDMVKKIIGQENYAETLDVLSDVIHSWKNDGIKRNGEKWHQFARLGFFQLEEMMDMYGQSLAIVTRYRVSPKHYFQSKFVQTASKLPDKSHELELFRKLFYDFVQIFKKIESQYNFDHHSFTLSDSKIRGRINWNSTLRKSQTNHPTVFETINFRKNFVTDENILLIISVLWMRKLCTSLLNSKTMKNLDSRNIQTITSAFSSTKSILDYFPYREVIEKSVNFMQKESFDSELDMLVSKTRTRVVDGKITNSGYSLLLSWLSQFRLLQKNIKSDSNSGNYLLEATKNLDTMYEVWIFLRILDYFYQNCDDVELHLEATPQFFEFSVLGKKCKFFYEKSYRQSDGKSWAVNSHPDFSVEMKGKTVIVFDAKNYTLSGDGAKGEAIHKVLGYMKNLGCSFGGIMFPKYPSEEKTLSEGDVSLNQKFSQYQFCVSDKCKDDLNASLKKLFDDVCQKIDTLN